MKKNILLFGSEGLIGKAILNCLDKKFEIFKVDKKFKKEKLYYRCDIQKINELNNLFKFFQKKNIFFSSIINATYPRPKKKINCFIDVSIPNFQNSLVAHLVPFYSVLLKSYIYFQKKKKSGQVISFSSVYGVKVPNFNIYKNTNIKSPAYYSASKSSLIILSKYFAAWAKFKKLKINFTSISPAGVRNDQSDLFQSNYKKIYKRPMIEKEIVAEKLKKIISNPKKFNGKNVMITNAIIL